MEGATVQGREKVPVSVAAHRLGFNWHRTYNWLLAGRLKGERTESGWTVYLDSIEAVERDRRAVSGQPVAA